MDEWCIAVLDSDGNRTFPSGLRDEPVWSVLTYSSDFTPAEMAEIGYGDELEEFELGEDGRYHFDEAVQQARASDLTYDEAEEAAWRMDDLGPRFGPEPGDDDPEPPQAVPADSPPPAPARTRAGKPSGPKYAPELYTWPLKMFAGRGFIGPAGE